MDVTPWEKLDLFPKDGNKLTGVMCRHQSGDLDEKALSRLRAAALSYRFCETHLGLFSGKPKDKGKHGAQRAEPLMGNVEPEWIPAKSGY